MSTNLVKEKTIIVKRKSSWGNEWIYPVCPKAKLFADIAGNKTLLPDVIEKVKKLGYNLTTESEKI